MAAATSIENAKRLADSIPDSGLGDGTLYINEVSLDTTDRCGCVASQDVTSDTTLTCGSFTTKYTRSAWTGISDVLSPSKIWMSGGTEGRGKRREAMSEALLVRKIIDLIESKGGYAVKYTPGVAGTPDILGCLNGRMLAIEVKVKGKKPTPIQLRRIGQWRDAGACSFCVDNLDDAMCALTMCNLV